MKRNRVPLPRCAADSKHMLRRLWLGALIACASLPLPLFAEERFVVHAEVEPAAASTSDGRYTLDAHATIDAAAHSRDGRFALKDIANPEAVCAPGDIVFKDSFEAP